MKTRCFAYEFERNCQSKIKFASGYQETNFQDHFMRKKKGYRAKARQKVLWNQSEPTICRYLWICPLNARSKSNWGGRKREGTPRSHYFYFHTDAGRWILQKWINPNNNGASFENHPSKLCKFGCTLSAKDLSWISKDSFHFYRSYFSPFSDAETTGRATITISIRLIWPQLAVITVRCQSRVDLIQKTRPRTFSYFDQRRTFNYEIHYWNACRASIIFPIIPTDSCCIPHNNEIDQSPFGERSGWRSCEKSNVCMFDGVPNCGMRY